MTYKMPAREISSLPLPLPNPVLPKVLYSLYEYVDHLGRWVRISDNSYSDTKIACRVFESRIMEAPLHREIRPIKVVSLGANLRFNR
jgi:hypothetical protein